MKTNNLNTHVAGLQDRSDLSSTTTAAPALDNQAAATPAENRFVYFQGPESTRNREGDEIPEWSVYVGNADQEPRSRVYRVLSFERARSLAQAMAKDRSLELITEAQPASDLRVPSQPPAAAAETTPVRLAPPVRPAPRRKRSKKHIAEQPELVTA